MKPGIRLISGRHLTAADKRSLLAVIEHERKSPPNLWGTRFLGVKGSPKSYGIVPDKAAPGRYAATIRQRERNSQNQMGVRQMTVVFETVNVPPLPLEAYEPEARA